MFGKTLQLVNKNELIQCDPFVSRDLSSTDDGLYIYKGTIKNNVSLSGWLAKEKEQS